MTKALLLLGFIVASTYGFAQAGEPDIIELRQAGQDLLAGDFDAIRAVTEAKGPVEPLQIPARAMARWIRQFPAQFPPGTEQGHATKALASIWSDIEGFRKAADTMAEASDELARLAKAGDLQGVTKAVRTVGAACRACHQEYRAR
jgi:cytochrome c556